MGYFDFSKDDDKTCFAHLDKHTPDSIKRDAREELKNRGYSEEQIRDEEYKRSRSW